MDDGNENESPSPPQADNISRRNAVKIGAALLGAAAFGLFRKNDPDASAQGNAPRFDGSATPVATRNIPPLDPAPFRDGSKDIPTFDGRPTPSPTPDTRPEQFTSLEQYLAAIEPEKRRLLSIIERDHMFDGFSGLRMDQILVDFARNYPFYEAAKRKYGVPVTLLWITHAYETTFSRNPTPEASGYVGCMQRDDDLYPDRVVQEAASGWDFLNALKPAVGEPGYHKAKGNKTTDYEEILFAAGKMRHDADHLQRTKGFSPQQALMEAQYAYCAAWAARDRINRFQTYYPKFQ